MIEFQGRFDSNSANALNRRVLKKLWWLLLICSAAFVVMGVLFAVFAEDLSDTILGIMLACFGVLFAPLVKVLSKSSQNKLNKTMSILSSDTIQIFQFYPDKLVITQRKGDEYEGITTAKYSYLYKVEETVSTYFLYISKAQSHVVNKADLTSGTLGDLNEILKTNLGAKFVQVK